MFCRSWTQYNELFASGIVMMWLNILWAKDCVFINTWLQTWSVVRLQDQKRRKWCSVLHLWQACCSQNTLDHSECKESPMFLLTWSGNAKERKQCKETSGCFTFYIVTQLSLLFCVQWPQWATKEWTETILETATVKYVSNHLLFFMWIKR